MTQETTTLQCWPGGAGYTFKGDINGPKAQRRLKSRSEARWRPGKAGEWRSIQIEVMAERYADRDVLCCDSSLVDDLIKQAYEGRGDLQEAFSLETIENMRPDPSDWEIEQCREYADDHGIEALDDDASESDWQSHISDNAEDAEVYEWWRVSSWLCSQLKSIGEVVIDNGYGHWWGRTCTGQGFIMDGTLQRVAASFLKEN